jgi:hypothetical protein
MKDFLLWGRNIILNQYFAKIICKIVISIIIISGVYFIMITNIFGNNFLDENWQIYPRTALGKDFYFLRDFPEKNGRFAPTGFVLYNISTLLPYGFTPSAHFIINAFVFVLTFLFIVKLLDFNSLQKTSHLYIKLFVLLSILFVIRSFMVTFFILTFLDTFLCLYMVIFLFAYNKIVTYNVNEVGADRQQTEFSLLQTNFIKLRDTKKTINVKSMEPIFWYIVCISMVLLATYCKEVVFGVFLIIAFYNLLFNWRNMTNGFKGFNFFLVLNAIIYLYLYYVYSFSVAEEVFAKPDVLLFNQLFVHFSNFPILILIIAFAVWRICILFGKDRKIDFYDPILFSCSGWVFAYSIMLAIPHSRFFTPLIIFFSPVLAHWLINFYDTKKYLLFSVICIFVCLCCAIAMFDIREKRNNFNDTYKRGRIMQYKFLKIDLYIKHDNFIVFYPRNSSHNQYPLTQATFASVLTYLNSDFFASKAFDSIRTRDKRNIWEEVLKESPFRDIKNSDIYVAHKDDISELRTDMYDAGFILFDEIQVSGDKYHIFIHKDRL